MHNSSTIVCVVRLAFQSLAVCYCNPHTFFGLLYQWTRHAFWRIWHTIVCAPLCVCHSWAAFAHSLHIFGGVSIRHLTPSRANFAGGNAQPIQDGACHVQPCDELQLVLMTRSERGLRICFYRLRCNSWPSFFFLEARKLAQLGKISCCAWHIIYTTVLVGDMMWGGCLFRCDACFTMSVRLSPCRPQL